ncbi:hypothetical protein KQ304_07730 [Synechococcus sp. CS-1329]|uniref:hypothetical protein n=1 Tax=Synechococcus sp. CS-1329 TaxID=2847975 RepID=UPI00223BA7AA|nr:hypothetical protein [Synechococcus sp. CS-1329]MCT0218887.1 hypothetical protein [Synechococcus sp. CS-1329]
MKILLSGVSGLGKTTLARYLVSEGIVKEHIEEDLAWIFNGDPRSPEGKKILVNRSIEWINERTEKLLATEASFVMDRGPVDVLHLWLNWSLVPPEAWQTTFRKMQGFCSHLDLLVLVPLESRVSHDAIEASNESGMKRVMTGYPDLSNQAKIYGLAYQISPLAKILALPPTPTSTEQRARLIRQRLKALLADRP